MYFLYNYVNSVKLTIYTFYSNFIYSVTLSLNIALINHNIISFRQNNIIYDTIMKSIMDYISFQDKMASFIYNLLTKYI